ncbi:MAG TPA: 4Fe-4S dicluster domain-containing protein [Spirochaetota bacterium]|nr:4Fe-4S dicluster domain-containing protein [Spirochaetota bacterium]
MGRSRFLYDLIMCFFKPSRLWERISPFRKKDSARNASAHIIPVGRVLHAGKSVVLPVSIIETLIRASGTVGIMAECLCRRGNGCQGHPADLGCLILGDATRDLDLRLGRSVTAKEAMAHARVALRRGLYPMVVHNQFDAWLWGVDYHRMLNICFCCDCCCAVRYSVRLRRSEGFFQNIHRLPGLTVRATAECDGCGECVTGCMARAITLEDGNASIRLEECKGCGLCAEVCPRKAIVMEMEGDARAGGDILNIYRGRTGID